MRVLKLVVLIGVMGCSSIDVTPISLSEYAARGGAELRPVLLDAGQSLESIEGKLPVISDPLRIRGHFELRYEGGKVVFVSGSIDESGSASVSVWSEAGTVVAQFRGKWVESKGRWEESKGTPPWWWGVEDQTP